MLPSAKHPEIQNELVNRILMKERDEDNLREVCQDPRMDEVLCKYKEFLTNDITSHKHKLEQPIENQIIGHLIEREVPLTAYHIPHPRKKGELLNPDDDPEYIGMPIEVPFHKNIGLKKPSQIKGVDLHPRLHHKCNCSPGNCTCNCSCRSTSKDKTKTKKVFERGPSSNDLKNQKLNMRKKIFNDYTKLDPVQRIRTAVKMSINRPVRNKTDFWEPNKYVIEQISQKDRQGNRRSTSKSRVSLATSHGQPTSGSTNIPILKEMVEIMDICLKKKLQGGSPNKAPSVSTKDVSLQTTTQEPLPARPQIPSPQKPQPEKKSPSPVPRPAPPKMIEGPELNSKLVVVRQDRIIKVPSDKKKIVKMVERQYELDKDSFELSELIHHCPSRVLSLASPLEKKLKRVEANDDLASFDTVHYTPQNIEIVDEHISELERRKIIERILPNVQIPMLKR